MSTPERLGRRALALLGELLALGRTELEARMEELGRADPELHDEVASLLRAAAESEGFLAEPLLPALPAAPAIPPRIGPFQVLEAIASGGMGVVVHARRTEPFLQDVAIKLTHAALPAAERERFADERRHLARIEHPNVARIIDGGELEDGHPYLAQEHVRGEPIDVHCARRALPLEARLELFLGVVEGVAAVHAAGVIHCDLKPDNVLVDTAGRPRLVDFGISQLAASPHPLTRYSIEFASPEIVAGQPPSIQSDVYALGRTLGRVLGGVAQGSPAAFAASPAARLRRADLRRLVELACAPALEDRYRSVGELAAAIRDVLARRAVVAPRRRRPLASWVPRRPPVLAAATAAVAVVLSLLGWTAFRLRFEARERALLEEATRRCAALVEATERRARRPLAEADGEDEAQEGRLAALGSWAESVDEPPNAGAAAARGCAAFAAFDFRRSSVELAPAARRESASPLVKRLWARSLWYRGRLDNDSVYRLTSGTEWSGPIRRLGRARSGQIALAFDAAMALDPGGADLEAAMLAVSRGRFAEAMRIARQRSVEAPADLEARRVEVEAALGSVLVRPAGGADLAALDAAIDAGLAAAPADPWLWLAECRRRAAGLAIRSPRPRDAAVAEESAARASSPCRTALGLAPDLADAIAAEAMLRFERSRARLGLGEDPSPEVAALSALVGELLARRPTDPIAYLLRGHGSILGAQWLVSRGLDPTELLARAQGDLEEALRLSGGASRVLNALGTVESERAAWAVAAENGAVPALQAAIARFEEALARAPATPLYLANLGLAQLALARREAALGRDVEAATAAAVATFGLVLELVPTHETALAGRATTRLLVLERRLAAGADVEALFPLIEADLERLAELGAGALPELRARLAAARGRGDDAPG